jgi:hypothetical protein
MLLQVPERSSFVDENREGDEAPALINNGADALHVLENPVLSPEKTGGPPL